MFIAFLIYHVITIYKIIAYRSLCTKESLNGYKSKLNQLSYSDNFILFSNHGTFKLT